MVAPSNLLVRFLRDESGQDLIEYALLTAVVAATSLVILASIRSKMSGAYVNWGAQINDARFHPNDPTP